MKRFSYAADGAVVAGDFHSRDRPRPEDIRATGATTTGDTSQALATSECHEGREVNDSAGNLVRALRRRLGMTQEELAAAVGVAFSTVSRWENAHREPSRLSWRAVQELARQRGLGEHFLPGPGPTNAAGPTNAE